MLFSCRFCPPSCTACREPTHDTGIISSVRNCFVPWYVVPCEFFQGCALVWYNTQRTTHFPARSSGISRKSNRKMGCSLRVIWICKGIQWLVFPWSVIPVLCSLSWVLGRVLEYVFIECSVVSSAEPSDLESKPLCSAGGATDDSMDPSFPLITSCC